MKANVNQEGCIGCGLCEQLCPHVFRLTTDGVAQAYAEVSTEYEAHTQEAAQSCPVGVIEIE